MQKPMLERKNKMCGMMAILIPSMFQVIDGMKIKGNALIIQGAFESIICKNIKSSIH